MIYLLKDMINPFNWIKLFLNPRKIFGLINRIFAYPGLKFGGINSLFYREKIILLLTYFAKKNENFQKFFYLSSINNLEANNKNFTLNISKQHNLFLENKKEIFEKLKKYGVIVIENALNDNEHNLVKSTFKDIIEDPNFLIKNTKSENIVSKFLNKNITFENDLSKLSRIVTSEVYGKPIDPSLTYYYSKSKKLPEQNFPGDNNMHFDRFLPIIKIIYFPYEVDEDSSPFRYALGSHLIDNKYLDFVIKDEKKFFDERNKKIEVFINCPEVKINLKQNSLIIALTNGLHGRTPFKKISERCGVFLTYPKFNMLSLLKL